MARVEIVKAYMKARTANNADEVGTYVADDIVLVSERDGTKTGKEEFLAYVRATPSNGTFQDPVEEGDKVVLNGTVSIAWVLTVSIRAVFTFNADNKIVRIEIGRA